RFMRAFHSSSVNSNLPLSCLRSSQAKSTDDVLERDLIQVQGGFDCNRHLAVLGRARAEQLADDVLLLPLLPQRCQLASQRRESERKVLHSLAVAELQVVEVPAQLLRLGPLGSI